MSALILHRIRCLAVLCKASTLPDGSVAVDTQLWMCTELFLFAVCNCLLRFRIAMGAIDSVSRAWGWKNFSGCVVLQTLCNNRQEKANAGAWGNSWLPWASHPSLCSSFNLAQTFCGFTHHHPGLNNIIFVIFVQLQRWGELPLRNGCCWTSSIDSVPKETSKIKVLMGRKSLNFLNNHFLKHFPSLFFLPVADT